MSLSYNALNRLVPISQFNKGKASQIFDRLASERELIVLKNNVPAAVILSPEEYQNLREKLIDLELYAEAMERLDRFEKSGEKALSFAEFMAEVGITEEDLENEEEPEFE